MGLGVIFMAVTLVVFSSVGIFAGLIGDWLRRRPAISGRLQALAGVTFIALGIRVALPGAR
jgi:threonine/homoserine/homoserine lactone efflux protein